MTMPNVHAAVAAACRILSDRGLARETTGHVSARADDGAMLLRCRDIREPGLRFATSGSVRVVSFDGTSSDLAPEQRVPHEWPIHAEILKRRPDVNAVVHVHPRATVLLTLAGVPLFPLVGAYDIQAAGIARIPPPIYESTSLVSTSDLGARLAETLGDHSVCLLRGHGLVSVGPSVEAATVTAIKAETLAEMTVALLGIGGKPQPIPAAEAEALAANLGSSWEDTVGESDLWRCYVQEETIRRREATDDQPS